MVGGWGKRVAARDPDPTLARRCASMPAFFPTRAHLLLCTGPDCARRDALSLLAACTQSLERLSLVYYKTGGSVRLTASGCLGACAYGPNVTAYYARGDGALAQAWYAGVTHDDVVALAQALHDGLPPPSAKRFDG